MKVSQIFCRSIVMAGGAAVAGLILMNAGLGAEDSPRVLEYHVTAVKGKLVCENANSQSRLAVGDKAISGDVLKAGWFSSAELAVESHRSRFLISARSRIRLAGDQPGILFEVEQGRIRAIFDKLEGDEPTERIVVTPSAILAVRGTEYGLAVAGSGTTTVVVFEGTVEVRNTIGKATTVMVPAGQTCKIQSGYPPTQPRPHSIGRADWDHGRAAHSMGGQAPHKASSSSSMGGQHGGSYGGGKR